MTEQSRPKPIELVARALAETYHGRPVEDGFVFGAATGGSVFVRQAEAALSILIKHGCISIEGIIARDEELARVAPVPERAGERNEPI